MAIGLQCVIVSTLVKEEMERGSKVPLQPNTMNEDACLKLLSD